MHTEDQVRQAMHDGCITGRQALLLRELLRAGNILSYALHPSLTVIMSNGISRQIDSNGEWI